MKVNADGRLDLTGQECVTIDPDTAKDFDDAISLTCDLEGHPSRRHIADVAAYVKVGSHLDRNAFLHCNSTYFPGYCLPMLPGELSNELCSLKPQSTAHHVGFWPNSTQRAISSTTKSSDPASKAANA